MVSFKSCLGPRNRRRPFPHGPLGFALGKEMQVSALLWLAITTHRHPCPQPVAREPRVPNLLSPHRDHRCDPACTAVPGWLPRLQTSRARPLGPPASPSVPTISWQEPCWLGRKGPANRTATIWGMELTSTLWSSDPHVVCAGRARAEVVFFFFLLFVLFQRWVLVRIALYLLGTGWTDFGIAVGVGGSTSNQPDTVSGPVFIFKNRQT